MTKQVLDLTWSWKGRSPFLSGLPCFIHWQFALLVFLKFIKMLVKIRSLSTSGATSSPVVWWSSSAGSVLGWVCLGSPSHSIKSVWSALGWVYSGSPTHSMKSVLGWVILWMLSGSFGSSSLVIRRFPLLLFSEGFGCLIIQLSVFKSSWNSSKIITRRFEPIWFLGDLGFWSPSYWFSLTSAPRFQAPYQGHILQALSTELWEPHQDFLNSE